MGKNWTIHSVITCVLMMAYYSWSYWIILCCSKEGLPWWLSGEESACHEMLVWSLGWEHPLEEGMPTHSSLLVQRIPWTEEPGGLQSTGSWRVGHNWSNLACLRAHTRTLHVSTSRCGKAWSSGRCMFAFLSLTAKLFSKVVFLTFYTPTNCVWKFLARIWYGQCLIYSNRDVMNI